ncbi:MAG: hypothetical protein CHACPFDD_03218 [Phycisphaerae bacterium]|nr:hypothetical protein [Phycisphaerae bacterium]
MTAKRICICVGLALLAGACGCSNSTLVAHNTARNGAFYGDYGVFGNNNQVTIARDSRLKKLSIIGDGNSVTVEDGARVVKIEFWGKNNTVSIPFGLKLREAEVGHGNAIVQRPEPAQESMVPAAP